MGSIYSKPELPQPLHINSESSQRPVSAMSNGTESTSGTNSPSRIPIPRANRSSSLRLKSASKSPPSAVETGKLSRDRLTRRSSLTSKKSNGADTSSKENVPHPKLVRSSSLVTSRDIRNQHGIASQNLSRPPDNSKFHRNDPFKRFSYVSPYSKKVIASERRSQSFSGVTLPCRHNNPYCQHTIKQTSTPNRMYLRPSFLPLSPVVSPCPDMSTESIADKSQISPSDSCDLDHNNDFNNDDTDSVKSFDSVNSAMSCDTAMKSIVGHHRNRKNIVHCGKSPDLNPDDYLTPTQRAARKIRELKGQLMEAKKEIADKQEQITRMTREMVLLRLQKIQNKAKSLDSPDSEHSLKSLIGDENVTASKPCFTPPTSSGASDIELGRFTCEGDHIASSSPPPQHPSPTSMSGTADSVEASQRSLTDSGNYDDLVSPCLSSKDSMENRKISINSRDHFEYDNSWSADAIEEHIRKHYEKRISEMNKNNLNEYNELKERHNDKVESLLAKLSEANLKYFELRPQHDRCLEKLKESEMTIKKLKEDLDESERRHQKMYLQMYLKGQQAAKIEASDNSSMDMDCRRRASVCSADESLDSIQENKATVTGLVKQLTQTEEELEKIKVLYNKEISQRRKDSISDGVTCKNSSLDGNLDPEVTLQFLKSAIYYFLTDRDNYRGHLRAIQSILGYTSSERKHIEKISKI